MAGWSGTTHNSVQWCSRAKRKTCSQARLPTPLSLPLFRGHPNSPESAIGGCHGKAETEEAAIVLAGVQGGDGPVGAGEREEPRDDRPGARSHRDSAARMGSAG